MPGMGYPRASLREQFDRIERSRAVATWWEWNEMSWCAFSIFVHRRPQARGAGDMDGPELPETCPARTPLGRVPWPVTLGTRFAERALVGMILNHVAGWNTA